MSGANWNIEGPSDHIWTPGEVAQIARAAQKFQAALPGNDKIYHLVTISGVGVIDDQAEITWPQPGEAAT